MATPIQENLVQKNEVYAANFNDGDLALPPAKKYAVGQFFPANVFISQDPKQSLKPAIL